MIFRILAVLFLTATFVHALQVGDKAPSLKGVKSWYNGEVVDPGSDGKITILDFWATWCGPCRHSIPHLNDLHKKYKSKGVVIAGITTEGKDKVDPFLKQVPMHFPVGIDTGGTTSGTYMAGRSGIPQAFLINPEGLVVWEGHPMDGLEEVLAAVVAGEWTVESGKARIGIQERKQKLQEELMSMMYAEDTEGALGVLDQLAEIDPDPTGVALFRAQLLLENGRVKEARNVFRDVIEGSKESPEVLGEIAWNLLQLPPAQRDLDLALDAAERAVKLTNGNQADHLDTLALAMYYLGDVEQAAELQGRAVGKATEAAARKGYQGNLDYYRKVQALRSARAR